MSMSVAIRELRNNTSAVIAAVEGGEEVVLTNRGRPIARIEPIARERTGKRPFLTRDELSTMRGGRIDTGWLEERSALRAAELASTTDWADPWDGR
ncbi:MAG: type II toxin-antitoxin system prevent-host-death family antitoxin [Schumannella sp.]|nr:type II toxin-antitoxin system prevent-host-death family antitoxin [Microbacteriaceae bacterium]